MDPLTAAHRRQLIGLRALVIRDLRLLWRGFDPADRASWDSFATPAGTLIKTHHAAAVALGARYYERLRTKRGVLTPNEVELPQIVLADERIATSLLATGLVGTYGALKAGKTAAAALDNGFVRVGMAGSRLALSGARDAVTAAARADGRSTGYIRATGGNPCRWCSDREGVQMTNAEVFQAHDGCSCVAEPTWAQ